MAQDPSASGRNLTEYSVGRFAAKLAAKEPVPGGGGAAALVGALGAALCEMVGNYTLGKEAYKQVEPEIDRMLRRAGAIRERMLELVDEDATAFAPLAAAYALPKDDITRPGIVEAATRDAIEPPLEMANQACLVIALAEDMYAKGSRNLASDAACAAALARAALEAAVVNVHVNTSALLDRDFANEVDADCARMLEEYIPRAQAVVESAL